MSTWRDDARCRTVGPEIMFPTAQGDEGRRQIKAAKEICQYCTVQPQCLAYALGREGDSEAIARAGIWGGLNPRERARLTRTQRQEAAA